MTENKLVGYLAMIEFLEAYNQRGRTDEVEIMLGAMQLSSDGVPMDPGYVQDWNQAYERAEIKAERIDETKDK